MIPIIKWTLWQQRWSTSRWSIGVLLFIFLSLIFYPSFKNDAAELQQSFANLPDAAVALLGGSTDFFSPIGFLNSQIYFLMLPLILTVLAISVGSSLLAREEKDSTLEVLLARPVARTQLLAAKALSGFSILLTVTLIALITILLMTPLIGLDVGLVVILQATLVCFLMVLSFASFAFSLTSIGYTRGASTGIAAIIALAGYIISSLAGTVSWLEYPDRVLPFYYYQPESILLGSYNWAHILFFILLIIGCGVLSWFVFRRRDLGY